MKRESAKYWAIIGLVVVIIAVFLTQPIIVTEVDTFDWVTNDDLFVIGEKTIADPDDSTNWHTTPDVYGDRIVYAVKITSSNYDIYMYDISTEKITIIEDNTALQYLPSIYKDTVVWTDRRGGDFDVYMKDLSTNITSILVSSPNDDYEPIVFEDKVVYFDWNGLRLHDMNSSTSYEIFSGNINSYDMWGDYVVFTPQSSFDIWIHNIPENTNTLVSTEAGNYPTYVKMHGNDVVYQSFVEGGWTAKYYSITDNRTYAMQPGWDSTLIADINDGLIASTGKYPWSTYLQISLTYVPDDPFDEQVTQITNDSLIKWSVCMTDSVIVWEEFGGIVHTRSSSVTERDVVYVTYQVNEEAELIKDVTYKTTYNTEWINVIIILGAMLGLMSALYYMEKVGETYE